MNKLIYFSIKCIVYLIALFSFSISIHAMNNNYSAYSSTYKNDFVPTKRAYITSNFYLNWLEAIDQKKALHPPALHHHDLVPDNRTTPDNSLSHRVIPKTFKHKEAKKNIKNIEKSACALTQQNIRMYLHNGNIPALREYKKVLQERMAGEKEEAFQRIISKEIDLIDEQLKNKDIDILEQLKNESSLDHAYTIIQKVLSNPPVSTDIIRAMEHIWTQKKGYLEYAKTHGEKDSELTFDQKLVIDTAQDARVTTQIEENNKKMFTEEQTSIEQITDMITTSASQPSIESPLATIWYSMHKEHPELSEIHKNAIEATVQEMCQNGSLNNDELSLLARSAECGKRFAHGVISRLNPLAQAKDIGISLWEITKVLADFMQTLDPCYQNYLRNHEDFRPQMNTSEKLLTTLNKLNTIGHIIGGPIGERNFLLDTTQAEEFLAQLTAEDVGKLVGDLLFPFIATKGIKIATESTRILSNIHPKTASVIQKFKGKFYNPTVTEAAELVTTEGIIAPAQEISDTSLLKNAAEKVNEKIVIQQTAEAATQLKPLGLGSTGRTIAENLNEQLAMQEIMADPTKGRIIKESIKDIRWKGWNKMSNRTAHDVEIHYVGKWENEVLIAVDDFKFKEK